jgi:hypothetical protein
MTDPYLPERQALIAAVTAGRGRLAPAVRAAIVDRARGDASAGPIPGVLVGFVDRVARDATVISDGDVDALTAAGFDDEAVFEAVVAAALGASLARLERVDQLLGSGGG